MSAAVLVSIMGAMVSIAYSVYAIRLNISVRQTAKRRERAANANAPKRHYLSEPAARAAAERYLARLEAMHPSERLQKSIDECRAEMREPEWWKS